MAVDSGGPTTRPNVLIIMCDQLRLDALGCYGNPFVSTPNIDRLAAEGVRAEHFFVQSPVCQPSRACFATGRYPRAHGVKYNWYDLPAGETTLQQCMQDYGYHSTAIGKMHFEPTADLHGFNDRVFVEGKMFTGDDEYRLFLAERGLREAYAENVLRWSDSEEFGAGDSPVPLDAYIDQFIADRACERLRELVQGEGPFFGWMSFVNPHMPFDVPPPYDDMYDEADIPLPADWQLRQDSRIPEHRFGSAGRDFAELSEDRLRRVRARYFGSVTFIDDCVGRVLEVLQSSGVLDDTVVIFTTDHGDFLGHRGLLWKGGRMMYDHLLRVPLVVRYPRLFPHGRVISELCESVDIMPTLLELVGAEIPAGVQGRSLRRVLAQEPVPDWRTEVFAESLETKMIRDHGWKLVLYPGKTYGEMYNLTEDRLELTNLYDAPEFADRRADLMHRLASRMALAEDPLPRPTRRPGYFEASGQHPAGEVS